MAAGLPLVGFSHDSRQHTGNLTLPDCVVVLERTYVGSSDVSSAFGEALGSRRQSLQPVLSAVLLDGIWK